MSDTESIHDGMAVGRMRILSINKSTSVKIDNEDYEKLCKWKWYAFWNKSTQSFYVARYEYTSTKHDVIFMHREIMNTPKNMFCDHKNHDTLGNYILDTPTGEKR